MASSEDNMEIEYVTDKGGAKLKLQVVDGRYYPTFPAHVIKNMASIKIRDDDVVLAGYLKAGTHWVWEIMRMLFAGTTDIPVVEKDAAMMEETDQSAIDSLPSPRVLNTHVLFDKLPAEVLVRKPKIVYLTRNPKDSAVSMFHHHVRLQEYYCYNGTLGDYLQLWVDGKVDFGSWFDHIKKWSEDLKKHPELQVLEVNYEDLTENPEAKIRDLATFLGLNPPNDLIKKIEEACSLERMRSRKGKFDLDTKGHAIMYRKGKVGGWKSEFTEEQNAWFDEVYKTKMAAIDTSFHWRFSLD